MHYYNPSEDQVQFFLDNIGEKEFTVIFIKVNGEQRQMTARLIPSDKKGSNPVPVETPDGIRSFRIEAVLYIGENQHSVMNEAEFEIGV